MTSVKDLVQKAKQSIENLSPAQVQQEAQRGALLVDLREPDERVKSGAIEGALHVPRGMLEFHADPASPYHKKELEPGRRVVLYCASGGRSALAGTALRELGYADIAHLDGGFKAWAEAGLPVARQG